MGGPLNGPGVRDAILKQGKTATEGAAYIQQSKLGYPYSYGDELIL